MGFLKKPKRPVATAQEVAITQRQERALDEEIGENEQRLRAQRRGQLGTRSLLAGAPTMPKAGSVTRASILQGINVQGLGGGM